MTFGEIVRLSDYRPKPHPDASIAADDHEYCEQSACPRCNHLGRTYRPFIKRLGATHRDEIAEYVYFAVCPACQFAEEI